MNDYSEPTQFIDLAAQQKLIRPKIDEAIKRVLEHGQYIMGPEVKDFEVKLSEFTGAKHALTCANGTDALTLALMAWGIGPGDAVFVPSFTYISTAEAPAQLGATPFFVDVIENTFNIDPSSFKQAVIECRKHNLKPSVVIVVDLFGQPANIDAITEIAKNDGIKVLVDGAQSFGAESHGRRVGVMGDATTTSFFPAKPLGCYGDGGAFFTDNDKLAEIINSIRLHGKGIQKYENVRIGVNSRMDTIQAAILIEKLKIFEGELQSRRKIAKRYTDALDEACFTPSLSPGVKSSWAQYTILVSDRDKVQESLKLEGIPSVIYYPVPLPRQLGYLNYPQVSSLTSVSDYLAKKVLSLPMHPYLTKTSQDHIIQKFLVALEK